MTTFARSVRLIYGAPLFSRRPVNWTFMPGFTVLGVQPKFLINCCGPPSSACHLTTLPFASGESNTMCA
jgi:hypothetical protein